MLKHDKALIVQTFTQYTLHEIMHVAFFTIKSPFRRKVYSFNDMTTQYSKILVCLGVTYENVAMAS